MRELLTPIRFWSLLRPCGRQLLLLTCVTAIGVVAVVAAQGPSPEMRQRIQAVIAAVNGADAPVDALVAAHFTPEFRASRTADEHRQWFASLRRQLGAIQPGAVNRRDRETVLIGVAGSSGARALIVLSLNPDTSLINSLALQPDDRPATATIVRGSMSDAEITSALDAHLRQLTQAGSFSGSVLVAREGKPIFSRGYGFANIADNVPNSPDTRFNLGSINKQFTKVLLAQLLREGKLAMSDVVGKYLADYPNRDAAKTVTLQQLMDHTAGLPDWMNTPEWETTLKSTLRRNADYLPLFAAKPLKTRPGTAYEYCNSCYVLLGAVIEAIEEAPYEDVVARRLFNPAGMTGAGFFAIDDPIPHVALGYTRRAAPRQISSLRSNVLMRGASGNAAGGAFATTADLLAWDNALHERRLLDTAGLAWFLGEADLPEGRIRNPRVAAGGSGGVNSAIASDGRWTLIVLTNVDPPTGERLTGELLRQLGGQ